MIKVAFLASEAVPFSKTGGLADVVGTLPRSLGELGLEVGVFLPLYGATRKLAGDLSLRKISGPDLLEWKGSRLPYSLWESRQKGFTAWLIDQPGYYDREGLYGSAAGDFPDNGERFAFFSLAALESMKRTGFRPDLVHGHDWQAAPALAYLKHKLASDEFFRPARAVFTIHNLAYQGLFPAGVLADIGLPDSLFNMEDLEFYGRVSLLKAGILYSAAVTTVSPTYSREIQTEEFGCGLDGLLRARRQVLSGILNGVDYSAWDPSSDPHLVSRYSAADLEGKPRCKSDLLRAFGLAAAADTPVVGMVTRLAGQKGLDILVEALPDIFREDVQLVILGRGEPDLEAELAEAADQYPGRLGLKLAFDETLARKVYAGSDMFLIPSRYEPCGLTQMYSLKYGAVPVVRATGGLEDTVREFDPRSLQGNGFKFREASAPALAKAVRAALGVYRRKASWPALVRNGMACDFSWDRSAAEYRALYLKLLS